MPCEIRQQNKKLTVGSCFSGIGGIELGLEWTGGFETRWQIENDKYASRILEKHWSNVKRYSDIRDVSFPERVDVICGGFPCQDVSIAGAKRGLAGKRSTLWNEMFRLICEVRPKWVLVENVRGLLSSDDGRFFGNILRDLAGSGFDAEWRVISAESIGAPHKRERVFLVAYPMCIRFRDSVRHHSKNEICVVEKWRFTQNFKSGTQWKRWLNAACKAVDGEISKSDFFGMDDGISEDVDRIKCIGNSVVPQVAQRIGEMILKYKANK